MKLTFLKMKSFILHSAPELLHHPLWRKRKVSPLIRFMKLQLIFFLGVERVYLKWINDLILPLERGETGLTSAYYVGLHEFEDMAFAIHLLRENDNFVDVGANLGSYSMLASGVSKSKSFAFEPVPATYNRLLQNIEINQLSNKIITKPIALTSPKSFLDKKEIRFSTDRACANSFVDENYKGHTTIVDVSTLDKELENIDPVLIKIDVEGSEEGLLQGAYETLRKHSMLAIIIEGQSEKIDQYFYDAGFISVQYLPFVREIKPNSKKRLNKLWVKKNKIELIKTLLQTATANSVYGNSF
jgi:FkbM family methyltransferase